MTIAADLERCLQRYGDARAARTQLSYQLLSLPTDDERREVIGRDVRDASRRAQAERAEHARLLAELVALAEGEG